MNTVLQIAKQAKLRTAVLLHIYGGKEDALCDSEIKELRQIEHFAELIIGECILAVYDDGQDAEYYQNRIKQHFGIE